MQSLILTRSTSSYSFWSTFWKGVSVSVPESTRNINWWRNGEHLFWPVPSMVTRHIPVFFWFLSIRMRLFPAFWRTSTFYMLLTLFYRGFYEPTNFSLKKKRKTWQINLCFNCSVWTGFYWYLTIGHNFSCRLTNGALFLKPVLSSEMWESLILSPQANTFVGLGHLPYLIKHQQRK